MTPWLTPPIGKPADRAAQISALIPVLETERLVLRAPLIGDFEAYRIINQSDRWPHDANRTPTDEEAWLDYNQMLASWMLRGIGLFAVTTKHDNKLVGFASIDHEWGDPEVEIGWMLSADAEGRGFATEAGQALVEFAAGQGRNSVVSYISKDNPRSSGVAKRLGGLRDPAAEADLKNAIYVYRHDLKEQQQ